MKSYHLRDALHDAYMAGQYRADRQNYLMEARRESDPEMRRTLAQWARKANHKHMKFLSAALAAQKTLS